MTLEFPAKSCSVPRQIGVLVRDRFWKARLRLDDRMLPGGIEPAECSFCTFGMTIALEPSRVYESRCVSAVYDRFDNAELLRSSQ